MEGNIGDVGCLYNIEDKTMRYLWSLLFSAFITLNAFAGTQNDKAQIVTEVPHNLIRKITDTQIACNSIVNSWTHKDLASEKLITETSRSHETVGITISKSGLKFLTSDDVEVGIVDPLVFSIVKNNPDFIIAVHFDRDFSDTVTINRQNGLAIWNRVRAYGFPVPYPDSHTWYFACH